MKKEKKYFNWVNQNIINITNKTILINGATGGIGSSLITYLSYLKNDLYLLLRNLKEGNILKERLEKRFHNKIGVIYFDYLDERSLLNTLELVKNLANFDYFINISGIYHQAYQLIEGV